MEVVFPGIVIDSHAVLPPTLPCLYFTAPYQVRKGISPTWHNAPLPYDPVMSRDADSTQNAKMGTVLLHFNNFNIDPLFDLSSLQ
jgi:hypothetical protein